LTAGADLLDFESALIIIANRHPLSYGESYRYQIFVDIRLSVICPASSFGGSLEDCISLVPPACNDYASIQCPSVAFLRFRPTPSVVVHSMELTSSLIVREGVSVGKAKECTFAADMVAMVHAFSSMDS
jgi:hypothetical protein